MPAFKLMKFLGEAPKISAELMPDMVAQYAYNCKLYSGDLIPYRKPMRVSVLSRGGVIRSLYPMYDGPTMYWLHWNEDVDAVKSTTSINTQRIFYTGQAQPRATDFTLATSGVGTNYPLDYYVLGLPAPTVAPTLSVGAGGSGNSQQRTYVYTWYTAWGEESSPSAASAVVTALDGQSVTVTTSTTAPSGKYQTTGMTKRIYRAVTTGAGTFYYYVAEIPLATATYNDTKLVSELGALLRSQDYDMPPASLKGIIALPNGFYAGFFDNVLCFSEPGQPHAWPIKYRQRVNSPIVGLSSIGTSVVVATESNPEIFTGTSPSSMSSVKLDVLFPCVAKASIVNMGWGVVYASQAGLVVISQSGNDIATRFVHYWDTWRESFNVYSISACYYDGKYFASHSRGGFVFERDDQVGGYFVQLNVSFTAAHYDELAAELYYVVDDAVMKWDDPVQQYGAFDWKSKVYKTSDMVNFGAARILADWSAADLTSVIAQAEAILTDNAAIIAADEAQDTFAGFEFNAYAFNDSSLLPPPVIDNSVLFKLYANKQLVFQRYVTSDKMFRLPAGYKTDTWEIAVSATTRVRAIHMAETPLGLKAL